MLTITVREAKAALIQMKKLTPAHPQLDDDINLTLRETIFLMAPELVAMTKRGFTSKELATSLQNQNIPIKAATLNRYLSEFKTGPSAGGAPAKTSRKKRKEPAPNVEIGTVLESAEAGETSAAETTAEGKPIVESTEPPSETAAEKSATSHPDPYRSYDKYQKQYPRRPPEENQRECRT
jgi:hypothetical protein